MTTIEYWITSSKDDLDTAKKLFEAKKYHHSLFFVHLALEKILKAIYASKQKQAALPIHDLVRLAQKAAVEINSEMTLRLAEISTFNVAARYDDYKFEFYKKATHEYAKKWLAIGTKLYTIFLHQL